MSVEFDAEQHSYRRISDEARYVSVTQALSVLPNPFAGVPPHVLERKRRIGLAGHKATELYDNGTLDHGSLHDHIKGYVENYIHWREESGFIPIMSEQIVHDDDLMLSGMVDVVGYFEKYPQYAGVLWIIDKKFTFTIPKTVGPQTAGYEHCSIKCGITRGWKRTARAALQLSPHAESRRRYRFVRQTGVNDLHILFDCLRKYRRAAACLSN